MTAIKQKQLFESKLSIWLTCSSMLILVVTGILTFWIIAKPQTPARNFILENLKSYNNITHGIFILTLIILSATALCSALKLPKIEDIKSQKFNKFHEIIQAITKHPASTIVLTIYAALMIHESSWFYKEILTWYDDINADYLLNNFSFNSAFISETMWRNDFRFFPISHQDLHILSWFTPYTKVWAVFSAFELIITIIAGCKIVNLSLKNKSSPSLYLMGSLLFIFTSAAAFNYFQFIYSERILTMLTALYFYQYGLYQKTGDNRNGRLAILAALFIPFLKDTAILLVIIPPISTIVLGSIGKIKNYPSLNVKQFFAWKKSYSTELAICSLLPFFLASFLILSFLPSTVAGTERYDSHLGFSTLELDIRLVILIGFIAARLWLICRKNDCFTPLDGMNLAALGYGSAIFGLVGFDGSNYMSLPIQLVAVIDILMIWETTAAPKLYGKLTYRQSQAVALGATLLLLNIEDRQAKTFRARAEEITVKQRYWRRTLNRADEFATKAKERGEEVNLIFTKGWFKHSDAIKEIAFDRLVYYDIDTQTYKIISGIDQGLDYTPKKGDLLINIDSGKKTFNHGIKSSDYLLIWQHDASLTDYAKIYQHL